jgi:outer membrane receptor protein involved in Fe transport
MKYILAIAIFGLAVFLLLIHSAEAGTTGKISGIIFNEETGGPLPGVAVYIKGYKIGTLTNDDGEFNILNVPVGTYTLRASLIGFASVEVTNVAVSIDLTTHYDFSLSKRALKLGKTIVVQAEKPLIIRDMTASITLINAEKIRNLPASGYQDIVGLQSGVIPFRDNPNTRKRGQRENTDATQLNIRGGRQSEVAYLVDGFSQQDPLSGMSTTSINNNALAELEIKTGGFGAEYGWVSSGIVNVTTKEGTPNFSGTIEGITDNLTSDNYDYNTYAANLGGPILGLAGSKFYFSSERRWRGDRQPSAIIDQPLPHNSLSGWSGQGKLSFKLKDNINLKAGGIYSIDNWKEYQHAYYFNAEHSPRYEDKNGSLYLEWTHTLSPKTYYSTSVSYFMTERIRGDGVHFDDIDSYSRIDGNPRYDETGLFWSWDDINGETDLYYEYDIDTIYGNYDTICTEPHEVIDSSIVAIDTVGNRQYLYGDESHVWDDFLHRKSNYIGFDFDICSQINPRHFLRVGFDFQKHILRYYRHLFPSNDSSIDIDHYGYDINGVEQSDDILGWRNDAKRPITWAIYAQDKFEWQDLVINAGLRFDYFDSRALRVKNLVRPFDPDGGDDTRLDREDLEESKAETRLSPRIGIGFPISEETVIHLSYGLFFQRPELSYLYVGYDFYEYKVNKGGYFYAFGNPNLEPEKTTAYEFGITHQLGDNTSIDLTTFYKDVSGLTQVQGFPASPKKYDAYFNSDFGTIKGLEFSLKMRRVHNIALDLNYSLSWSNGTGSYANSHSNVAWTSSEVPIQTSPLDYDQRHKLTGIVDYHTGRNEGPVIGGVYPFGNISSNIVFNLASGTPYSPMKLDADPLTLNNVSYTSGAPRNSRYSSWKFRIDLKMTRTFYLGGVNLDIYVWILNLLDRDNAIAVYESSGDPEATNWLNTSSGETFQDNWVDEHDSSGLTGREKYELKQKDPANFDIPRQIRFGLRMSF